MKCKFVLAAALAGACLFVVGCNNDSETASLNGGDSAVTAAETKACSKPDCCKKGGDVAAAETKAKSGCCSEKAATCSEKGDVAAAETKAKSGCCAEKAATCSEKGDVAAAETKAGSCCKKAAQD